MPAADLITPNLYQLSGHAHGHPIHVTYTTNGLEGKPHLSYQDSASGLSFAGNDIRVVDSDVGQLVSVTIRKTVDTGSTSFSLLLPHVKLPAGGKESTPVKTNGVVTVHRFSPVPSFNIGQSDLYTVVELTGTAVLVLL